MVRVREKGPSGDILPGFSGQIGVSRSALNDRARGGKSRRKANEKEQTLPPAHRECIRSVGAEMEDHGFPPKHDIFKAMAQKLAKQSAEQKRDSKLGKT